MKFKFLLVSVLMIALVTPLFSESDPETPRINGAIITTGGFDLVGTNITRYTGNSHPFWISLGFSLFPSTQFSIDFAGRLGLAGQYENVNGAVTSQSFFLYGISAGGSLYLFNPAGVFTPFVGAALHYCGGSIENNILVTPFSDSGTGFGASAKIGALFNLGDTRFHIALHYEYIPVYFHSFTESIGGLGLEAGYVIAF